MDRQNLKFNPILLHAEEEPDVNDINIATQQIFKDIISIDDSLIKSANNFKSLLDKTKMKMLEIKQSLAAERERQQDINILCNKYSDFSSVLTLKKEDFDGDLDITNNIVSAKVINTEKTKINVKSINGNGYEGNKFVYLNNRFINEIIDTSNKNNIIDNNLATAYEYSRITTSNEKENTLSFFNPDSIEAECSLELEADNLINKIIVSSERNDIILKAVYTSLDGLTYHLDKEYNVSINERGDRYNNQNYIYGSGIIAIEPTKYFKLVFKSNGYTEDVLAYIKTFYNDEKKDEIVKKIQIVNSAKRHVIQLNDITCLRNKYGQGMLMSKELISTQVNCIALCCNEYINKEYTIDNNVSYFLIINGQEHEVVPINCHRNKKKIIRMSSQTYESQHVIYINETIKSAKLKIVINSTNRDITPYISDIKILVGGI